jgi:hypothetical protein
VSGTAGRYNAPCGDPAQALGVVDSVDGSLARLVASTTGARVDTYGGRGAERALAQVVDGWISDRRPGVDRLSVTVRYGAERPPWLGAACAATTIGSRSTGFPRLRRRRRGPEDGGPASSP